jgi:hypothetical protein
MGAFASGGEPRVADAGENQPLDHLDVPVEHDGVRVLRDGLLRAQRVVVAADEDVGHPDRP